MTCQSSLLIIASIPSTIPRRHVAADGDHLVTGGHQLLCFRLHRVLPEIGQNHGRACLGERLRRRQPMPMSFSTAALGRRALPIVVSQCEILAQKEKLRDLPVANR
jgi:hypothetical protein